MGGRGGLAENGGRENRQSGSHMEGGRDRVRNAGSPQGDGGFNVTKEGV